MTSANGRMKILYLHGWQSVPGGVKPTYLKDHGHAVSNPALPDDDFEQAVRIAQDHFDQHRPDVVVGASRGGAVAMNVRSADTPLVLLCPAWKKWGVAKRVKLGTVILHSRADDVVPFENSEELISNSGLQASALVEVGDDHRLADPQPLAKMLEACQRAAGEPVRRSVCKSPRENSKPGDALVEVTVHYLEMLTPSHQSVPAPLEGLTVLHAKRPSVAYYRFLYQAVGEDYHWLSRRKLTDDQLAAVIGDPKNELHVLHVEGSPAGFAELDRRQADQIELVQFGLMAGFIGQGLGKWFLQWTLDKTWSYRPQRFWLHTCTLDHAAALPTYQKAGFVQFKEERIWREL